MEISFTTELKMHCGLKESSRSHDLSWHKRFSFFLIPDGIPYHLFKDFLLSFRLRMQWNTDRITQCQQQNNRCTLPFIYFLFTNAMPYSYHFQHHHRSGTCSNFRPIKSYLVAVIFYYRLHLLLHYTRFDDAIGMHFFPNILKISFFTTISIYKFMDMQASGKEQQVLEIGYEQQCR